MREERGNIIMRDELKGGYWNEERKRGYFDMREYCNKGRKGGYLKRKEEVLYCNGKK